MPGQLLRLRLLGSPSKLLVSPGGISVLKRAFPFKLKYSSSMSSLSSNGFRAFSSARKGNPSAKAKSLMEDEAELSDWISDMKMDNDDGRKSRAWSDSGGETNNDRGKFREGVRYNDGGEDRIRGNERGNFRSNGYSGGIRGGREMGRNSPSSLRKNSGGGVGRGRDSEVQRRPPRGRESGPMRKTMMYDDNDNDDDERGRGIRSSSSMAKKGRMGSTFRSRDDGDDRVRDREIRSSSSMANKGRMGSTFRSKDDDDDRVRDRGIRSSSTVTKRGRMGYAFKISDDDGGDDDDHGKGRGRGIRSSSSTPKRGRRESAFKRADNDNDDYNDDGRGGGIRSLSSAPKGGRMDSTFKISDNDDDDVDDDDNDDDVNDVDDVDDNEEEEEKGKLKYSEYREKSTTQYSDSQCDESYLTDSRFDQCDISSLSLKGVKAAGYERMTVVQAATLPEILKGKDVLAKAKTGTGKTVAFLLPSIEVVSKAGPVDRDERRQPIRVLVVCPTRELANQAAMEAEKLLKFHASIGVQVVTGGTRLALEQKRMQANPCQILVATPGRLRDHIENTAGFATRLMGVKVLILDEADHLLDMGFRKDIERIVAAVPKQRQTLLFSATVPDEVRQICYIALKRDHEFINTVVEGEETHSQVSQLLLVAPLEKQFPTIYGLLTDHIADNVDYKILVFCTTAMVTKLVAEVLSELKLNIREMHSRKPQSYRTRVSDEFRKSKGIILVTSDVSARGVDYPDVTLVIQVGVPSDREQYIHRLGRTGRKGKQGQGILILAPWEEFFVSSIKDLPVSKASPPLIDPETRKKVERALAHVEMKNKEAAYQAWLGYYNSNKAIGRDKARLVSLANEFSRCMGLDSPPALSKLVLGKMGLRNVPGLRSK